MSDGTEFANIGHMAYTGSDIAVLSGIASKSACADECNLELTCLSAEYELGTTTCTTKSSNKDGLVALSTDSRNDYLQTVTRFN